jgi:chromosome segregation ATPase
MKGRKDPRELSGLVVEAAETLREDLNALALKAENEALKKQIELLERNLEDLREEIRFSRRAIETAETQTARRRFWQRPN